MKAYEQSAHCSWAHTLSVQATLHLHAVDSMCANACSNGRVYTIIECKSCVLCGPIAAWPQRAVRRLSGLRALSRVSCACYVQRCLCRVVATSHFKLPST
eukprot:992714-Pleurochrysis_carterae.AAC.3